MTFFLPITNTKGLPFSRELSNCLSFNNCHQKRGESVSAGLEDQEMKISCLPREKRGDAVDVQCPCSGP
jgi:hypothetical protein